MSGKGSRRRPENAEKLSEGWKIVFGRIAKAKARGVELGKAAEATMSANSVKRARSERGPRNGNRENL